MKHTFYLFTLLFLNLFAIFSFAKNTTTLYKITKKENSCITEQPTKFPNSLCAPKRGKPIKGQGNLIN